MVEVLREGILISAAYKSPFENRAVYGPFRWDRKYAQSAATVRVRALKEATKKYANCGSDPFSVFPRIADAKRHWQA
jgi:hypothetical protein